MIGSRSSSQPAASRSGSSSPSACARCPRCACSSSGSRSSPLVLPLAAVLLSGWVMFHMGDDVKILAVAAASASAAVFAALFLARSIADSPRSRQAGDSPRSRPATWPHERPKPARASSPSSPGRSTRWPRTSNDSSTRAASSSPGRATTCARRSPRSQAMLEAIEDGLATPSEYLAAAPRAGAHAAVLVDDLFELARIDAGCAHARAARRRARAARRRRACAARGRGRVRGTSTLEPTSTATPTRALRAGEGRARAAQPADERPPPHALRRGGRGVASSRRSDEVRVARRGHRRRASPKTRATGCSTASGAATPRAQRRGGAGLGLAIARGLVEAHGGTDLGGESRRAAAPACPSRCQPRRPPELPPLHGHHAYRSTIARVCCGSTDGWTAPLPRFIPRGTRAGCRR